MSDINWSYCKLFSRWIGQNVWSMVMENVTEIHYDFWNMVLTMHLQPVYAKKHHTTRVQH